MLFRSVTLQAEIEQERATYLLSFNLLNQKIERFNRCADTAGCFAGQAEFNTERNVILNEQTMLEADRDRLNAKIDRNNQLVDEYHASERRLGELSAVLNSNIEIIETLK